MKAATITRTIHSRQFNLAVAFGVVGIAVYFFLTGKYLAINQSCGLVFPSVSEWIPSGWLNFGIAILGNAFVVGVMMLLNKIYNILRSMTFLFIGLYALISISAPAFVVQLYSGIVLAVVISGAIMLMYRNYMSPAASTSVFFIFFVFSAISSIQYHIALYIPLFLLVCAQMRILSIKTFIAAILGVLTPWWILFGFGIITPEDVTIPEISSIIARMDADDAFMSYLSIGITAVMAFLALIFNALKAIAYNARFRAMNGTLTILLLYTIIVMMIDFANMSAYVPVLNFCAALQIVHYLANHRGERSFIAVLLIFAVYASICVCQIEL